MHIIARDAVPAHQRFVEERRQEFVGFYGGPDEPGYVHNVLGLPGDPEYSLFPERLLKPALTWIPDYLTISLRWDARAAQLSYVFATTTEERAQGFFERLGFKLAGRDQVPASKWQSYEADRLQRVVVLRYDLESQG